ncbi:MAG: stage III sporulation protein AE [Acutalibacteraceae bacterium]
MKKLITFLLLLFLLPQRVQAAEADETRLAAVESAAGVGDISEPDGYDKTTDGGKKDLLSSSLTVIQNTLTDVFGDVSGTLFCCWRRCCWRRCTGCGAFRLKVLESAVELLLVLALSGILYSALKTLFEMTRQAFLNLSVFLTSFLPVTASLYTMTGNTATAAAGTSMMLLFNTAVVALAERFLFPLLQVCFALSLVSAVPNGVSLHRSSRW